MHGFHLGVILFVCVPVGSGRGSRDAVCCCGGDVDGLGFLWVFVPEVCRSGGSFAGVDCGGVFLFSVSGCVVLSPSGVARVGVLGFGVEFLFVWFGGGVPFSS